MRTLRIRRGATAAFRGRIPARLAARDGLGTVAAAFLAAVVVAALVAAPVAAAIAGTPDHPLPSAPKAPQAPSRPASPAPTSPSAPTAVAPNAPAPPSTAAKAPPPPEKPDPPEEVAKSTLTSVGQPAPDFTVETLDGRTVRLSDLRGKVVLVNFFATWCGPCRREMPHLEQEIWRRWQGRDDFFMLSIGREETAEKIAPFVEKYGVTFPFAPDPERKAYAPYASAYIPRNYVVGRDGTILFQSQGYEEPEFARMVETIAGALASPGATAAQAH